jgi:pentatricopeptide repeat protein
MQMANLEPDEKTYNSLINACAKAGVTDRAEHWFRMMELAGCKVDKITFGSVIHASAKVGNVARAEYWMDEMIRRGVIPNLVCFNTVLHACAHNGDHQRATKWFQKILGANTTPNKITFNSMIDAYAKAGDVASAEMWLQQMVAKGFHPDQITYVTLLRACTHVAQDTQDSDPDENARWTYGAIIRSYAQTGSLNGMKRWLGEMVRAGFKPSRRLAEEIHYTCAARGKRELGDQIFALMRRHIDAPDQPQSGHGRNARHQNQTPSQRSSPQAASSAGQAQKGNAQQAQGLPLVEIKPMPEMRPMMSTAKSNDVRRPAAASEDISLEEIRDELQKLTEEDDGHDIDPLEPPETAAPLEQLRSPGGSDAGRL